MCECVSPRTIYKVQNLKLIDSESDSSTRKLFRGYWKIPALYLLQYSFETIHSSVLTLLLAKIKSPPLSYRILIPNFLFSFLLRDNNKFVLSRTRGSGSPLLRSIQFNMSPIAMTTALSASCLHRINRG